MRTLDEKPDNNKLLIRIDERVRSILERLEGNVPEKCTAHETRIATSEEQIRSLWGRIWWIVGVPVAGAVTLGIYLLTH